MFIQITLCVLLILGFAWLLWMLSGALLTPVRSGRDTRITLVVQARAISLLTPMPPPSNRHSTRKNMGSGPLEPTR